MILFAAAPMPSEFRMFLRKPAPQAPAMIVFIDRYPRMNLKPNRMTVLNRLLEWIELPVIHSVELFHQVQSLGFGHIWVVTAYQLFIPVGLRRPKTIAIPPTHGVE